MKFLIIFMGFMVLSWAVPTKHLLNSPHWVNFKSTHNKEYNNIDEEFHRYNIFQDNLEKIKKHNKLYDDGLVTFKMKMNHFGDLTSEEFLNYTNLNTNNILLLKSRITPTNKTYFKSSPEINIKSSIDWRQYGIVTNVKNQGDCGSCWTFSVTGALEGQYALKYNKLMSFSEQNLLDCSYYYGTNGCNGGFMDPAFAYIKDNGIETEYAYPYETRQNVCRYNPKKVVTKISDYMDVTEGNEDHLTQAVSEIGPVSAAIEAKHELQFYSNGIYHNEYCSEERINHAILVVGYGSKRNMDYYLIKNSWGTSWGENGYMKIARNCGNMCGIASIASFPIL